MLRPMFTPFPTVSAVMWNHETCVCEACGESFESESELRGHVYAVGLVE